LYIKTKVTVRMCDNIFAYDYIMSDIVFEQPFVKRLVSLAW